MTFVVNWYYKSKTDSNKWTLSSMEEKSFIYVLYQSHCSNFDYLLILHNTTTSYGYILPLCLISLYWWKVSSRYPFYFLHSFFLNYQYLANVMKNNSESGSIKDQYSPDLSIKKNKIK